MHDFAGRTAVVTGAGSGIGLALARAFTELGMRVVLADRDAHAVDAAAAALAEPSSCSTRQNRLAPPGVSANVVGRGVHRRELVDIGVAHLVPPWPPDGRLS
jgi:NAD(P)-dependent dehydrogenase (short-subunit alcohol dehydrogenase family)